MKDRSSPINWNETPVKIAEESILNFKQKSAHNKTETHCFFIVAIAASLLTPISIIIGGHVVFEKILPALFPAITTFCTIWTQLRKPQLQWVLYRRQQRELEWELLGYNQEINEYENHSPLDKDKILTKNLVKIFRQSHEEWEENVPDSIPNLQK